MYQVQTLYEAKILRKQKYSYATPFSHKNAHKNSEYRAPSHCTTRRASSREIIKTNSLLPQTRARGEAREKKIKLTGVDEDFACALSRRAV